LVVNLFLKEETPMVLPFDPTQLLAMLQGAGGLAQGGPSGPPGGLEALAGAGGAAPIAPAYRS